MATDPGKNINTFLNHIKKLEEQQKRDIADMKKKIEVHSQTINPDSNVEEVNKELEYMNKEFKLMQDMYD